MVTGLGWTLITGNPGKLAEARRLVEAEHPAGFPPLGSQAMDLPEIQSLDLREVLSAKAEEAYRRLGRPVVVDDTALGLAAWGGFPGPLVKWMLEAVGPEGIARTAHALGETAAIARVALLYRDAERQLVGEGVLEGEVVMPRGNGGFGWDPIFLPAGETRTFAELPAGVKDRIGPRGQAWRDLLRQLNH